MKKRTILVTGILAATVSQGATSSQEYLEANTGSNQKNLTTLCLKVTPYSIASMGPGGVVSGNPIGLVVSKGDAQDILKDIDHATGDCESGYIKITTTAPLMSLSNAPVGL